MVVVIRWIPQHSRWYICHALSYQNAFRNNGFKTRGEAVKFAESNGCNVEKHDHDRLQDY